MNRALDRVRNEDGSVLVIVMLMLVLLTFIGMAATTTSTTEVQIAGNMKVYKRNLYRAEAGAIVAGQQLENATVDELTNWGPDWLNVPSDLPRPDKMINVNNWVAAHSVQAIDTENRYLVLDLGIDNQASLDMSGTMVHKYYIYGRSNANKGLALVEMGYRRRF
ncbi:MAG: hypothetical protein JSU72_01185 [Deltaproteobacteria bacterium]|nr:MAG: hypothetical protein JSU72_01185 [Deltaproteobacteria bacterium]